MEEVVYGMGNCPHLGRRPAGQRVITYSAGIVIGWHAAIVPSITIIIARSTGEGVGTVISLSS